MEEPFGPRLQKRVLTGLVAGVVLVYLGFLFAATDGHFVPQVVDLYLVCQYARAMAEGHPFHYYPGEPASTGATSLLHTALLAAAHAAGIRGEWLVAFAVLSGAGFFLASVFACWRIGGLLGGEREGFLAGALVALGGPVVWGFLYGSDISLAMLLASWLCQSLLTEWHGRSLARGIVAAVLLGLTRPEAVLVGVVLGLAWTLGPGRTLRGAGRALVWMPAAGGLAVAALHRWLTGLWVGTSVADKSLLANYGFADSVALLSEYGVDVLRGLLLGLYPSEATIGFSRGWAPFFFPPLGLLLILLALVRAPEPLRPPLRLWIVIVAVLYVAVSPSMFMGTHFNRYLMWAFPTLLALCATGLGALTRLLSPGDPQAERSLFRAGAGLLLVLGLLSTLRFAALYGELAGEIYRRDLAAARWITDHLPRGVAIANLATSVEYLTGHRSVNLHGVTSPGFFGNRTVEREAGVLEALSRMPAAERPAYLMTTVSAQESYPSVREMVDGPPLFRTSSMSDEILIFRMRYDIVGRNARIFLPETLESVRGLAEVDRLNVCDSRDEAAHGYEFGSRLGNLRLNGAARLAPYSLRGSPRNEVVADGGRAILGSESFEIRTRRGKDLLVVLRTASSVTANVFRASGSGQVGIEFPEAGIVFRAGSQIAGRLSFRPRSGWDERVFRVPGALVGEGHTRLTLSGRYASFYYWFFQ